MSEKDSFKNLISNTECLEIFKKAVDDGVNFLSYDIFPILSGAVGFLGDYFKLQVIYSKNNNEVSKKSFFMKSLPIANEIHRNIITSGGYMKKELLQYKTLFRDLEKYASLKWHPDMYLCRDDILVLEDLIESNFNHNPYSFNCPPKYVWPVLKTMAAMHANCIVYEAKCGVNIGKKYADCLFETVMGKGNTWVDAGLKAICKVASIHPRLQNENYQKFIKDHLMANLNSIYKLVEPSEKYQNTLNNRDLWQQNLFFRETEGNLDCVLIDFQVGTYCPPAIDVLIFLYLNTTRQNRNENFVHYLNYYYEYLLKFTREHGVNLDDYIDQEEFNQSCEEFKIVALAIAGIYYPVVYLPDGLLPALNKKDAERYHHLMLIDRSDFVLECIEKFKDVGLAIQDAVEEIVEYAFEKFA